MNQNPEAWPNFHFTILDTLLRIFVCFPLTPLAYSTPFLLISNRFSNRGIDIGVLCLKGWGESNPTTTFYKYIIFYYTFFRKRPILMKDYVSS